MILKGIIEEIISQSRIKVRIPLLHRALTAVEHVQLQDIPEAQICTLPSTVPNLQCGDVVIVAFENNDLSRPIIIGHLFTDNPSSSAFSSTFESLTVRNSTRLSTDTAIGNVTAVELQRLQGVKENLQQTIDLLWNKIDNLQTIVENLQK